MNNPTISAKLETPFFEQDILTVAPRLLGKVFCVKTNNNKLLTGKIVEVEAYQQHMDEASHSFKGKTKRNEVMFYGGGFLYVYLIYGIHFCANVVTGKYNSGSAILLRGIEPITEIDSMAFNRYGRKNISDKELVNLTNGPGKICSAFGLSINDNGTNLTGGEIFILDNKLIKNSEIVKTSRIGIKKSVDLQWRFYIKNNRFVSK